MTHTLEDRIEEARIMASKAITRLRPAFPVADKEGVYPIVVTVPEEPLLHCAERAQLLAETVNLIIVTGDKLDTCVLHVTSETMADPNAIVLPDNSAYTIGQYLQDTRDLNQLYPVHAMGGLGLTTDHPLETLIAA